MRTRFVWSLALMCSAATVCLTGCQTTMPSALLQAGVALPGPVSALQAPDPNRFFRDDHDLSYRLSARSLINIAFHAHPDIKSSFHRFKSEEARYDFFYSSRDALTPRFRTTNTVGETREPGFTERTRDHTVEIGVERRFFDTTELDVAMGLEVGAVDEALGNQPFVAASVRYPLSVSRQKLDRTSEEIYRRNELDDAQLAYIQMVRSSLQDTLFRLQRVMEQRRNLADLRRLLGDLQSLLGTLESWNLPAEATDRRRLEAELARAGADIRNLEGRYEIDIERLKAAAGIPFYADVELIDEPFNPFGGADHAELFRMSVDTDPEIATLRSAERNAKVQLDLARRGRWELTLMLDGRSGLDGGGERDGVTNWSVSVGLEVSAVDERVIDSLIRQSQSNIARFTQAIAARENQIFVDTFEPLIRIETLGQSRDELRANLPRYQDDYDTGVKDFQAGKLNIDDLLKRRETLLDQEEEVSRLTLMVGVNVAELCAATGKFFELLIGDSSTNLLSDDAG